MEVSADELAGIVELFGSLSRDELRDALAELAFKQGDDPPDEELIDQAVEDYVLVVSDQSGDDRLAVGPTAFPELPPGAEDLPHILAIEPREVDRSTLAPTVEERFRRETARAVAQDDQDSVDDLLDVSYDLEAWGPVDLTTVRERIDAGRAS